MKEKLFFSTTELRLRWNVHRNTIYYYINKGILPCVRLDRKILIPVSAVLEYEAKSLYRKMEDREKYIRESLADFPKGGSA